MNRPTRSWGVALAISLTAMACSVTEGTIGTMSATTFTAVNCLEAEAFEEEFNALAIDACVDLLYIRAQDANTPTSAANGMLIQIPNASDVMDALEDGPVTLNAGGAGITASLFLNRTCPDAFISLEASAGTITIYALTTNIGGTVHLEGDLVIEDTKYNQMATSSLTFAIDTSESSYRPMRDYPICP